MEIAIEISTRTPLEGTVRQKPCACIMRVSDNVLDERHLVRVDRSVVVFLRRFSISSNYSKKREGTAVVVLGCTRIRVPGVTFDT